MVHSRSLAEQKNTSINTALPQLLVTCFSLPLEVRVFYPQWSTVDFETQLSVTELNTLR